MKKLLFQLDTDSHPSVFDTVVAYDGGADQVIGHGNITPENVGTLVDGAIFTRAPKEKKNTALFIGGSNMQAGQAVFEAVKQRFFGGFRVSAMLDSNGSNTTAAAAVARLMSSASLAGKSAVVLAGTGPVGQRAAVMLARAGVTDITLTSRVLARAEAAARDIRSSFSVEVNPVQALSCENRALAITDAEIVLATGANGVELLRPEHWQNLGRLQLLADANATPPLGIGGVEVMDRGAERSGKIAWGAIGFGTLKLALHRTCIAKMFETNDLILDAEEIFAIARSMP